MKRLILCCDGTWNRADQESNGKPSPTNVIKIAYRLCKHGTDGTEQIIFYDQGVGTGNALDRILGGATGAGLEGNIHDAYIFLIANYEPGDQIYLFGFSRGAFTARSIGGMIRKCGILSRTAVQEYPRAEALYHDPKIHPDDKDAVDFRTKNSLTGNDGVPIQMVGVWDTVGALGIPLRGLRAHNRVEFQFHDTELSGSVKYAFHALAIDEHRAPFEPSLWEYKPKDGQTVEQVWFPGVHSDVGGGYSETFLSDITLGWMIDRAKTAGLEFDEGVMKAHPTTPKPTGVLHNSMSPIYRLQRALVRPVGLQKAPKTGGDPTQSLHQSVLDRWTADRTYRPQNVRDYLVRTGDPRGKQP
jgi:uncharacterized protein (DUF2235 family)